MEGEEDAQKIDSEGVEKLVEGDDRLNESCTASFDVPGYVSFHFSPRPKPEGMREWMKQMSVYRKGLRALALKLENPESAGAYKEDYATAHSVVVTSWMVKLRPDILTGSGFLDNFTDADEGVKKQLIDVYRTREVPDEVPEEYRGPDGPVACMRLDKETFSRRYGLNNKDK